MSGQEMVTADEARQWLEEGATLLIARLARTVVALHAEVERLTAERDNLDTELLIATNGRERWRNRAETAEAERDRLAEQKNAALALHEGNHWCTTVHGEGLPFGQGTIRGNCPTARALGVTGE